MSDKTAMCRAAYPYVPAIPTRSTDNEISGQDNDLVCYIDFDPVINE